jgi:hypothetical protein
MQASVKQDREKYIGGSDIPVIMEISPFKTRFDLLLEKAGYKENDFDGNVYTEYGNTLEPIIRDYINKDLETGFYEGKHTREAEGDEIIGVRLHTDGERLVSPGKYEVLEIKTTGTIFEDVNDYKIYLVQLLYYMVNLGAESGLLAVYERPGDLSEAFEAKRLHLYHIDIADYGELLAEIESAINRFIEDLEKVKENPFISESELLPTEITDITRRIIAFESQLAYFKEIEAKAKSEKARLKNAMQAAGVKSWTTPNGYKITLVPDGEDKTIKEESLDLDSLRRDLPELFRDKSDGGYIEKITITKKGRAGYVKITEPKKEGKQ